MAKRFFLSLVLILSIIPTLSAQSPDTCNYTLEIFSPFPLGSTRARIDIYNGSNRLKYYYLSARSVHDSFSFLWTGSNLRMTWSQSNSIDTADIIVLKDNLGITRAVASSNPQYKISIADDQGNQWNNVSDVTIPLQCPNPSTTFHTVTCNPFNNGIVTINGQDCRYWNKIADGTTIIIGATPDSYADLVHLKVNGASISNPDTIVVTEDIDIDVEFYAHLPELHVSNFSNSDIITGSEFSVSWTVRNDGNAATPVGKTWNDYLILSPHPYVNHSEREKLGTYQNVNALDVGESYTRTVNVTLPIRHATGEYYLFLITDADMAADIQWPNDTIPSNYQAPPYVKAVCYSGTVYGNVSEISEQRTRGSYNHSTNNAYLHDNFAMRKVNVVLPPLADLVVTNIVAPSNFYCGTPINVTATIKNCGAATTRASSWNDRIYISYDSVYNSNALSLTTITHRNAVPANGSYQVNFSVTVPLTWYGPAYFYVITDIGDSEYEHIGSNNNTTRSEPVNIILTPPADLVVSNVSVPSHASNQMPFSVDFTVQNAGMGNPNHCCWYDYIFLSTSPTLPSVIFNSAGNASPYSYATRPDTLQWAYQLGTITHNGGLSFAPDATYSIHRDYSLPSFITDSGTFYIIVVTDYTDLVFEYDHNDNNATASNASEISFFYPDLVVDTIILPDTIDNNHSYQINFTICNKGLGKSVETWSDRVRLQKYNSNGSITEYVAGNVRNSKVLMPGECYTSAADIRTLPGDWPASGEMWAYVKADYDNRNAEQSGESNNERRSRTIWNNIYQSDFTIPSCTLPDTIVVGYGIDIPFVLGNEGNRDFSGPLYFNVFYSLDSIYNYNRVTSVSSFDQGVNVLSGRQQNLSRIVTFPTTITDSLYYIFIRILYDADYFKIFEANAANNTVRFGPVYLCHRPLPDLKPINLSIPSDIHADDTVDVEFDVVNIGDSDMPNAAIHSSVNIGGMWCPVVEQMQPASPGHLAIRSGDTLHFVQRIALPPTLTAGTTTCTLTIDADNLIQETDETNNTQSLPVSIQSNPIDIAVSTFNAPTTHTTGESFTATWTASVARLAPMYSHTVRIATDTTGYSDTLFFQPIEHGGNLSWIDRLYVSADATLSADDTPVNGSFVSSSMIDGSTYSVSVTAAVPHARHDARYLIVVADADSNTLDQQRANNTSAQPISVTLAPRPNLRITAIEIDDTVQQKQGCLLRYTVVNDGTGPTDDSLWTDLIECASLNVAHTHQGRLLPGQQYTDSVEIVIPQNMIGDYTLTVSVDADNVIYEHENESDNIGTRPLVVLLSQPCDLVVSSVSISPEQLVAGDNLRVAWTIQNIGNNEVNGYVKDGIYLSADSVLDNSDVMIGELSYRCRLQPSASISKSGTYRVMGITEGVYHVIVRTNMMSAFNEVSFANNRTASDNTVDMQLPTLVIGQSEEFSLPSRQQAYYRMEVGPELEGQTLAMILTTPATNAFNGLYISHQAMPTSARYDYGTTLPYATYEQVLITSLRQGTYYVMVSATTTNSSAQQLTLQAQIINFEILTIDADEGTNTGSLTTHITGAKFDTVMDFRLVSGETYIPAQKVHFGNSTQSYVTFNLTDLPSGSYDVEAELPGGITTRKQNAFIVDDGLPSQLIINILAPASVRAGSTMPVNIEYGNNGRTDLNVSGFMVVSQNGHHIALNTAELANNLDTITFYTAEPNMDPDIMRPGYFATKTIYLQASNLNRIILTVYPIRRRYE